MAETLSDAERERLFLAEEFCYSFLIAIELGLLEDVSLDTRKYLSVSLEKWAGKVYDKGVEEGKEQFGDEELPPDVPASGKADETYYFPKWIERLLRRIDLLDDEEMHTVELSGFDLKICAQGAAELAHAQITESILLQVKDKLDEDEQEP